jgi:hypothetical protein
LKSNPSTQLELGRRTLEPGRTLDVDARPPHQAPPSQDRTATVRCWGPCFLFVALLGAPCLVACAPLPQCDCSLPPVPERVTPGW